MVDARTLVLVDGSSYLYRAFHALPPLTNSRGEPTGAVLGVLNMLLRMQREQNPELVAVVFDAPGKTFRDELFAEYKAHRPPMPDDLRAQIEPLIDAVQALGLPLLRIAGVEADDVIGTLAQRAADAGLQVLISTGDKDMAQLVNEHITLVNTMTNSSLDRAGVKVKFDVYPEQIIDYLALVGDTSDNIPGVPKVGPKTAAKWLNEYRTLDNLLEHQDRDRRQGRREPARVDSGPRAVARARHDPLRRRARRRPRAAAPHEPDVAKLRELYTRLELRSLLKSLGRRPRQRPPVLAARSASAAVRTVRRLPLRGPSRRTAGRPAATTNSCSTQAHFERWLDALRAADVFAFDTETTSLDYMQAEIVGVSFAVEPGTRGLRAARAHLSRRAGAAGPRPTCCDCCSRCSRTSVAASSAIT